MSNVVPAELIVSKDASSGINLRFPRCQRIREDKDPWDVINNKELWEMLDRQQFRKKSAGSDRRMIDIAPVLGKVSEM